ncbi:MAG: DUF6470 family protein [Oscillospiraceae bacterium]|nr:DUF6470 family protein [Oscillospiraceae bacterium]
MSKVQRIMIEHQLAELGIRKTPARLNIKAPTAELRITSESAQMEIQRTNPTFRLSRRRANAESGLSGPSDLARQLGEAGRQGAKRGARKAVADGNFLGEMRRSGDRVGQLAQNKAMDAIARGRDINIGLMPTSPPEVVWDMGEMNINWSKHSVLIDWDGEFMPELTVDPKHSIEIFLRTEPYFRVSIEETVTTIITGKYVDDAI